MLEPSVSTVPQTSELYLHVRVLLGMVVGLGLTHLLRNFARIVEHPGRRPVYWVHLLWALSMFLYLVHFWWWEFRLHAVPSWNFNLYLFVVIYALLLYLACALIFPEQLDDYAGYRDYFYSRRAWFFGTIAAIYAIDYADTWLKGSVYLQGFGLEYPIRNAAYIVLAIIGMCTRRRWFHATFAVAGLIYQVSWIARMFERL